MPHAVCVTGLTKRGIAGGQAKFGGFVGGCWEGSIWVARGSWLAQEWGPSSEAAWFEAGAGACLGCWVRWPWKGVAA
jgi:hypothetical protein